MRYIVINAPNIAAVASIERPILDTKNAKFEALR